jgi:hypothetical protein
MKKVLTATLIPLFFSSFVFAAEPPCRYRCRQGHHHRQ